MSYEGLLKGCVTEDRDKRGHAPVSQGQKSCSPMGTLHTP